LDIWSCLGFNFILLTAIGEILVPRNVEKFAFFTVHLKTITSSERCLNNGADPEKTLHKAGHSFLLCDIEIALCAGPVTLSRAMK
jgi:hypothetical protein